MPLTPEEADEVLQALRARVRDSRLNFIDESATAMAFTRDDGRGKLIRYLDAAAQQLAAAAGEPLERTLGQLREYVRTAEGRPISEIAVSGSPTSDAFAGEDLTVLRGEPLLMALAEELARLRDEISNDTDLRMGMTSE